MKTLILLQPYGRLAKGDEMQVTSGVAALLISRGIAREKKSAKDKGEAK